MKLGELKALIRKTKGNPSINVVFGARQMNFQIMKGPLLDQLDAAFPGGKAVETHLRFDEDSNILIEEGKPFGDEVVNALKVSETFDLDDLDDVLV